MRRASLFFVVLSLFSCSENDSGKETAADSATQDAIAAYQKTARQALEGSRKKRPPQAAAFLNAQLDENLNALSDSGRSLEERRQAANKIDGLAFVVDPHRLVEGVKQALDKDGDLAIQKRLITILQGLGAKATEAIPVLEGLARDNPKLAPAVKRAVDSIKADS